jgi:hypothetical protein
MLNKVFDKLRWQYNRANFPALDIKPSITTLGMSEHRPRSERIKERSFDSFCFGPDLCPMAHMKATARVCGCLYFGMPIGGIVNDQI